MESLNRTRRIAAVKEWLDDTDFSSSLSVEPTTSFRNNDTNNITKLCQLSDSLTRLQVQNSHSTSEDHSHCRASPLRDAQLEDTSQHSCCLSTHSSVCKSGLDMQRNHDDTTEQVTIGLVYSPALKAKSASEGCQTQCCHCTSQLSTACSKQVTNQLKQNLADRQKVASDSETLLPALYHGQTRAAELLPREIDVLPLDLSKIKLSGGETRVLPCGSAEASVLATYSTMSQQKHSDCQASHLLACSSINNQCHRGLTDTSSISGPLSSLSPTTAVKNKVIIGNRGWLEDTSAMTMPGPASQKPGILESLRRKAKGFTAGMGEPTIPTDKFLFKNKAGWMQQPTDSQITVSVSLNAREQSILYCELEYTITTALNDYIISQLNEGRLEPLKLQRVAEKWASKGRPRVVAFRYDLETQIDLIVDHVRVFRFYGWRQGNHLLLSSVLEAMRTHAREISVRSFCQPDLAIRRQIEDTRALCDIIGACPQTWQAVDHISWYFYRILDRQHPNSQTVAQTEAST